MTFIRCVICGGRCLNPRISEELKLPMHERCWNVACGEFPRESTSHWPASLRVKVNGVAGVQWVNRSGLRAFRPAPRPAPRNAEGVTVTPFVIVPLPLSDVRMIRMLDQIAAWTPVLSESQRNVL